MKIYEVFPRHEQGRQKIWINQLHSKFMTCVKTFDESGESLSRTCDRKSARRRPSCCVTINDKKIPQARHFEGNFRIKLI